MLLRWLNLKRYFQYRFIFINVNEITVRKLILIVYKKLMDTKDLFEEIMPHLYLRFFFLSVFYRTATASKTVLREIE